MAENIDLKLKDAGYLPEQDLRHRKIVSTSEQGKTYILQVKSRMRSDVYQVDGYIIADKKKDKCDKLVLINKNSANGEDWAEIFVELKGKNVKHAIEQLEATIKEKIFMHSSVKQRRARIVAAAFPANNGNSEMERAKVRFQKLGVDLRGLKNGQPDFF